jgi:hypothetical protein
VGGTVTLSLYRSPHNWTVLCITFEPLLNHLLLDDPELDKSDAATIPVKTNIEATSLNDLEAVEGHVRATHGRSAWKLLLEATHDQDPDLHARWVSSEFATLAAESSVDMTLAPLELLELGLPGAAFQLLHDWVTLRGYSLDRLDVPRLSAITLANEHEEDQRLQAVSVSGVGYTAVGVVVIDENDAARLRLADTDQYPLRPAGATVGE